MRTKYYFSLLLPLVLFCIPFVQAVTQEKVYVHQLRNGFTLIVKPDHRAPTVVHMLMVRAGSRNEESGATGAAHALEHMMFKGTSLLGPGEFSRRIASLGGSENAFTSKDYTGYYQQVPHIHLEEVMKLEADRFANNQWEATEFFKEIEVVKEERRLRTEDNPRSLLWENLMATALQVNPYRHPIVGWMTDLEAMQPRDLRRFYANWYKPRNAAIIVVGDVEPKKVKDLAEKYYGVITYGTPITEKPQAEPKQKGLRRFTYKARADQPYLIMAWHVPKLSNIEKPTTKDQDAIALSALSAILDGNEGTRLEKYLIRSKDPIADSVSTGNGLFGLGPQLFWASGTPAKGKTVEDLEKAILEQIKTIADVGVEPIELQRVKNQWLASEIYKKDSLFAQAREIGFYWIQKFNVEDNQRFLDLIRGVTPEQVQNVAKRYFNQDQLTIAVLEPDIPHEGTGNIVTQNIDNQPTSKGR